MLRKILRRTLIAVPALVLAYQGVVAVWAWNSADELVAAHRVAAPGAALSPRQQHILLTIEDSPFSSMRA